MKDELRKALASALNRHANPGVVNAQMEEIVPILDFELAAPVPEPDVQKETRDERQEI